MQYVIGVRADASLSKCAILLAFIYECHRMLMVGRPLPIKKCVAECKLRTSRHMRIWPPCSEPMLPAKKKQPLKSERMKNERMDACANRVSI
jgi:hypothetical protein